MKFLLDTNACIRFINGRSPRLRERFLEVTSEDIAVCSVVKAELFYSSAKSHDPEKSLMRQREFLSQFISLPFDYRAAAAYGILRAGLEKSGTLIGPNDLMIAAIAISNQLILVTANTAEFGRVVGLQSENWEA